VRSLRALWRTVRVVLHGLHGMWIIASQFGGLDAARRMQRVQWWSAKYLRLLGMRLVVEGAPQPGTQLVVANHVSWLDVLAINAVLPCRFVSKSEVRHWPLIGWLVTSAGTLYIERARPRDAMRVVHQMAAALEAGHTLAIFPEGTTSEGHALLPFHANLLQAAIASAATVQPLALRYSDATHAVSPAAAYVGETSLFESLRWITMAEGLIVRVQCLPAEPPPHADRRQMAERLAAGIQRALQRQS
jgi:1-acyl-sn-glycerol-3-phosphate acyltransferase